MALIKVKQRRNAADIRVKEVGTRSGADLLVRVVQSKNTARGHDGLWRFVESSSIATCKICWVQSRSSADLLVRFVSSKAAAGWRRPHRLQGKL